MKGIEREAITETESDLYELHCSRERDRERDREKETERKRQRDTETDRKCERKGGGRKREGNSLGQKRCVGADSFFHGC